MIKITVDQSVEDALQRAFPRPHGAAYRALAKYVSAVEAMINEAVLRGLLRSPLTVKGPSVRSGVGLLSMAWT